MLYLNFKPFTNNILQKKSTFSKAKKSDMYKILEVSALRTNE